MRGVLSVLFVLLSCQPHEEEPPVPDSHDKPVAVAVQGNNVTEPQPPAKPAPWTFVVMSDLHLPNYNAIKVERAVAAIVAMHPRLVVITGDHTNGSDKNVAGSPKSLGWWGTVTTALQPLRDAKIAVLPIAGNHDSYLPWQRARYAAAFGDLTAWSAALQLTSGTGSTVARAPFSYSVDLDGVHLSLVHVVAQGLDHDVASWLANDLAAASSAKHRIVFGHVPLSSVIQPPNTGFVAKLGAILEQGHAELYIAGHEHVVWDEDVALPGGGKLRQVLVGCTSGFYDYGPTEASKQRARCVPISVANQREPMRCKMPNGGEFELARGRKNRHIQHYKNSFTVFTVDGDSITPRPMTIDDQGRVLPFYLNE